MSRSPGSVARTRRPARLRGLGAAAIALAAAALVAACSGDNESAATGGERERLIVSAAASLTDALSDCSKDFPGADVRLSFAGSDELAAQIRQGVKPDVFASANTKLPDELHAEGLVEKPVTFAGNELVLAVPAASGIGSLRDAGRAGTSLAIGSESVPVGAYTRAVLSKLPEAESSAILGNVRSEEPDVAGIVGKLTQGAVDAGFVYVSDVRATDGALKAVELPESLQPTVAYGVAVVKGGGNEEAARAFVDGLLDGAGCFGQVEGQAQHHRGAEDGGDGVGLAGLQGRRGAVDWFVEPETPVVERRRRRHTERAQQGSRFVREDIAEQVGREHDVVLGGVGY
jgi:molybdate transport system substrate-binding protein